MKTLQNQIYSYFHLNHHNTFSKMIFLEDEKSSIVHWERMCFFRYIEDIF